MSFAWRPSEPQGSSAAGAAESDRRIDLGWTRHLPSVAYDREQCAERRILVPDSPGPANRPAEAAYRMLRTRVLQRARANRWNTLAVTSPGVGEGKSVTVLNLALTIAREQNSNVFLVDLDLRDPSMCPYLGIAPPTDLSRYFRGLVGPESVLFSIGIENLALAGSCVGTDDASELLASGRVEQLFEHIQRLAPEPLILVDLPPIMVTDDALVVAPKVDACLLVLSEGVSRRDSIGKSLELLTDFDLAGIVLNQSRASVTTYYGS